MRKCHEFLGKDSRYLKLIFLSFALLLLLEELYTFFVLKPTLTSSSKRNINYKVDFPQILLCPEPSVDITALKSLGYSNIDLYVTGMEEIDNGSLGFAGNNSQSVEEVSEKISVIKSIEDCPIKNRSYAWYDDDAVAAPGVENLQFKLKKVSYPHHICCELVTPKAVRSYQILGLSLAFSFENKLFSSFKIFMSDKTTESFFTFHKSKMLGDKINLKADINGFMNYKVEIKEEMHLEDDPNYPCIEYKIEGEYHKCLENEIVSNLFNHINCTPPWMTENQDLWCKGRLKFKSDLSFSEYWKYTDQVLL